MTVGQTLPHESSRQHVTGEARFVDDLPLTERTLIGRVVTSPIANGTLRSYDLTAARKVEGVHAVLSASDIPGHNQMGPVVKDEACLAEGRVSCIGQAVFLIAAETSAQCREAERLITAEYVPEPPVLSFEEAVAHDALLGPPRTMGRGDVAAALDAAPLNISGELRTGAAEHWYLETQVSLCIPGENRTFHLYCSTQHPSETQALVAEVLGISRSAVTVEVRRMGGGFGGKETQANHVACWSALLSNACGAPVKIRLNRDDDMCITGKRHPFLARYAAGFDEEGTLLAVRIELNSDAGMATDLSFAIMERAMLHCDNAYFLPAVEITARVWKTNHPSNTAFRGFGGPQGMAVIETILDRIARTLGKDPLDVRLRNFYASPPRHLTPYEQPVRDNRLPLIVDRLLVSSRYRERRKGLAAFNAAHRFVKRGLALTPVKFGISFTTTFLNQAGALVHVYADGTVLVSHGGTEMGQGLHTKIRQIAAECFGIDPARVTVGPTDTSKVPNTSATAASSGADLNGMAVAEAVAAIRDRMSAELARYFTELHPDLPSHPPALRFKLNTVTDADHPDRTMAFPEVVDLLYRRQISLSAAGYYRTPSIGWDKIRGKGNPFHYFAYGAAVSEVEVDLLTGGHTLLRTDIVHDAGDPINPGIDMGQVQGGFVQGVGWCTTEEIVWDAGGRLLTHSPDTYKIPTIRSIPKEFHVELLSGVPNTGTIFNSKAVGEPPLMLALSVWLAIKDAVASAGNGTEEPPFSLPATNEVILAAVEHLQGPSIIGRRILP